MSRKKKSNNNDPRPHKSSTYEIPGGVIGGGLGAYFGPEFAAIGVPLGTAIGNYGPQIVSAMNPLGISTPKLIGATVEKDFYNSVLHEYSLIKSTHNESKRRIDLISKIKRLDFARLTPEKEVKWLQKEYRGITLAALPSQIPDEYRQIAENINKHSREIQKLVVSC